MHAENVTDRRKGGGANDAQPHRADDLPLRYRHGAAHPLVQLVQRRGAEHDLSGSVQPLARQRERGHRGVDGGDDGRDRLAIDFDRGEIDPGGSGHQPVAGKQRAGPPEWQGPVAVNRVEGVIEVPSVQGRM